MNWRNQLLKVLSLYLTLAILLGKIHFPAQDYREPGKPSDVQAQLNWIGKKLRSGGGEATQSWYPEGFFFAHALYGYALVNQAMFHIDDETLVRRNAQEIQWVLGQLESKPGYAPFPEEQAVVHGVFYMGWQNRLLGGFLLIQAENERDPDRVEQFHYQSQLLAQALAQSPTWHLEAYPGGCWPVDNVVALTSLRIHDELYGTHYGEVIKAGWPIRAFTLTHRRA